MNIFLFSIFINNAFIGWGSPPPKKKNTHKKKPWRLLYKECNDQMQKFILFVLISGTIKFLCYYKNHYLYWKVGGEITLWSLERKLSLWLASWFQKRHLSENSFCDNDIFDSIFLKDYYSSYVLDVALCLTLHLVTNPVSGAL